MRGRRRGEGAGGVFRIGLIGPVVVEAAGAPVILPGARPTAMLAMLALAEDGRTARATLLDRFWGERPEAKAAAAFRQTLHTLRRALGSEGGRLRSGGGVVALDLDGVAVDLRAETARPLLRPAAERGALAAVAAREALAGLSVSAGEAEAWIAETREGWRTYATRALRDNLAAALDEADWRGAWALARALETLDPWCEAAQAALMRAEAALDGPGAAARRREAFAARLDAELGVAPTPAFDDAARSIGRWGTAPGRGPTPVAALRWPAGEAGLGGLARATLARELSRMGVPVLLAEPETDAPPALYAVTGDFAASESGRALRVEVLAPGAAPILLATLPLRRAEDVADFEARVAVLAREAGRRVRAREAAAPAPGGRLAGAAFPLAPEGLGETVAADGPDDAAAPSAALGAAVADGPSPAAAGVSGRAAAGEGDGAASYSAAFAVAARPLGEAAALVASAVSVAWGGLDRAGAPTEAAGAVDPARAMTAAARDATSAPALSVARRDAAAEEPGADRAQADRLDFLPRADAPAPPDPADPETADGPAGPARAAPRDRPEGVEATPPPADFVEPSVTVPRHDPDHWLAA